MRLYVDNSELLKLAAALQMAWGDFTKCQGAIVWAALIQPILLGQAFLAKPAELARPTFGGVDPEVGLSLKCGNCKQFKAVFD